MSVSHALGPAVVVADGGLVPRFPAPGNAGRAAELVDERPEAYKDIDAVMEDQKDLATVQHTLRQVFNYKG
ncbi:RtcB family protein [Streptosporangium roseum]|uniref:RtcB family protein n=1 Tax=Streptosporangium roseum TaxID=2001 RepID=UPI00331915BC